MDFGVNFRFDGGRFIVAGASSGMGKLITEEIARAGGSALAIARDEERLLALSTTDREHIFTEAVDVRDQETLERAIQDFVSINGKVHGCVYTAGISAPTPLRHFSEDTAREIMDINYWGFINLMKLVNCRKYSEDGCSNVVIASVAGHTGEAGSFAYSASKAAVMNSVRTFAKEIYKRGNRINSISPGFVNTRLSHDFFEKTGFSERTVEKHLLGIGECSDISGLALFLLSSRSRWITGQDFAVDGGYLVSD